MKIKIEFDVDDRYAASTILVELAKRISLTDIGADVLKHEGKRIGKFSILNDLAGKYCTCRSITNPCIVCGLIKRGMTNVRE